VCEFRIYIRYIIGDYLSRLLVLGNWKKKTKRLLKN